MRSFGQIVFLLVAFASISFSTVRFGFYNDPKYPGKCAIRHDIILSPGEGAPHPKICGQYICQDDGGIARIVSCGSQAPADGCVLGDVINRKAAYPECCLRKEVC